MTAPGATQLTTQVVDILMLAITIIIVVPRMILSVRTTRKFGWDDGWLLAAFVFCIALIAVWLHSLPVFYRLSSLDNDLTGVYDGFIEDMAYVRKIIYTACFLFLLSIWSTKFSLLCFYRQILTRLGWYIYFYWITVVFCALTLIGTFIALLYACQGGPKNFLDTWGCLAPDDDKHTLISFWFVYAADNITTLMVMFLPLGVIRESKMPMKKKLSIIVLFCLGFGCIIFATIRTTYINGAIQSKNAAGVVSLALWGTIEAALACIIASAPGLYREVVQWKKAKMQPSQRTGRSSSPSISRPSAPTKTTLLTQEMALSSCSRDPSTDGRVYGHSGTFYNTSQEELTRPQQSRAIHVTRSVGVHHTDQDWHIRDLPKSWEDYHSRAV